MKFGPIWGKNPVSAPVTNRNATVECLPIPVVVFYTIHVGNGVMFCVHSIDNSDRSVCVQ